MAKETAALQYVDKRAENAAEKAAEELAPQFDVGEMSQDWWDEVIQVERRLNRFNKKYPISLLSELSEEEEDAILEQGKALAQEQLNCVSKVLLAVPREWLIKRAPEHIDWRDPQSMKFLQAGKPNVIYAAMCAIVTGVQKKVSENGSS